MSAPQPSAKRQKTHVAPFQPTHPPQFSSSTWVNQIFNDLWIHKIFSFLLCEDLATAGRSNTYMNEYWHYLLKQNVIHVPSRCPTMHRALQLPAEGTLLDQYFFRLTRVVNVRHYG